MPDSARRGRHAARTLRSRRPCLLRTGERERALEPRGRHRRRACPRGTDGDRCAALPRPPLPEGRRSRRHPRGDRCRSEPRRKRGDVRRRSPRAPRTAVANLRARLAAQGPPDERLRRVLAARRLWVAPAARRGRELVRSSPAPPGRSALGRGDSARPRPSRPRTRERRRRAGHGAPHAVAAEASRRQQHG